MWGFLMADSWAGEKVGTMVVWMVVWRVVRRVELWVGTMAAE